jgi:hypothetical protein
MKTYPSIPRTPLGRRGPRRLHLFDKIDGSNLRFEWTRREGWIRFGTRRRVIDNSDPIFGSAFGLFEAFLADPLARVAGEQGWEAMVAYAEFHGPGSLGGQHDLHAPKRLTLFDVAPHKRGLLGPEQFLEWFGELEIPAYLGEHEWNDDLVGRVRRGELPGVTFEGVVGKARMGNQVVMAKAKTQAWIDRILAHYGAEEGGRLIQS